ncbi:AMIN domain-containing protein [Phormidium tenue FACHB-886]|nr:AMIN domain-containing protein [Phormidium tenue FACHB-886]
MPRIEWSQVLIGSVAILLAAQPAGVASTQITSVQINTAENGVELELNGTSDRPPQIFMVSREETWIADVINAQLSLEAGDQFRQDHPTAGIDSVTVSQLDANSIRIEVVGAAPSGELLQKDSQNLTFHIQAESADRPPSALAADPEDTLSGQPLRPLAPTPLPRAIAPPVGDIAVSATDASPNTIDLGTTELVPRLVLRNAPARDALSLLARAAGLNLVFSDLEAASLSETVAAAETPQIEVSLDIENEPIQDVFNYVLQLTGLEANQRGRTIFVATQLPNASRNFIIRSLRVNQVQAEVALNFLVAMGAESAVSRERLVTSVNAIAVRSIEDQQSDSPIQSAVTESQTTTEQRLETQRVDYQDSAPPLRGLLVFGDERTNTITLSGTPRQIEIAAAQLAQLDVRRRQVTVNVRVIDVDLSAIEDFGGSFSFGVNDVFVEGNQGNFSINVNDFNNGGSSGNSRNAFAASLDAEITSGNAKILTDPTLIVQEGQTATVALTEEVPTTTGQTTFSETGEVVSFEQDPPRAAGLTLAIEISRIDDNGFVSLSVAPTITAPSGQQENPDGSETTLLSSRSLQSGQVRLRDGQTLILSGIIQDSDRTTISKVPILGDLPLLGILFRSTERTNERREVIVLLTPQIVDDSANTQPVESYTPEQDIQRLLPEQF